MNAEDSTRAKRIGLVDYRLDNFHADVFTTEIRAVRHRGYEVAGAYALKRDPSVAWAERNGIAYYDDLAQLCVNSDCMMILAPSNPEFHLELCQQVFPFGKTTYVDKTFAPDLQTAEEIFLLADHSDVAIQTSSAMRYTGIQPAVGAQTEQLRDLTVWGGGTSFAEYGIHAVELAVSCLGPGATRVVELGTSEHPVLVLYYDDGRTATIHMNAVNHAPFRAAIGTGMATELITVDDATLFANATNGILTFFDAGVPQVDRRETLLIRRILDIVAARSAVECVVSLRVDVEKSPVPAPMEIGRRTSPVTETNW